MARGHSRVCSGGGVSPREGIGGAGTRWFRFNRPNL